MRSNLLHKTSIRKNNHADIVKSLKKRTQGVWISFLICCLFGIVFFPINNLFLELPSKDAFIYFSLGAVFVSLVETFFYFRFIKNFKDSLIVTFLAKYLPGHSYLPNSGIKILEYKDSLFCPEKEKEYKTFDFVNHKQRGYKYYFSQVQSRRSDKSSIFSGIFATIELKVKTPAHTIIIPESLGETMGKLISTSFPGPSQFKGKVTKFEDNNFEKYFSVYSDDQPEGKVFVNPKLIHLLNQKKKSNSRNFFLSFKKNHLYIGIPLDENFYNPTFFGLNKSITQTVNDLSECLEIIHEMIEFIYLEDIKLKIA